MAPSVAAIPTDTVSHLPLKLSANGEKTKGGDLASISTLELKDVAKTDFVLRTFRCLIADLCEQFKGGHPGSAMGMAAIGVALWKYVMRYSPENPNFFNRDRFVLSNGEFLHLLMLRPILAETDIDHNPCRSLLFMAIHIYASCRLQEHDT